MSIIYALISRGNANVLVDCTKVTGNFQQISRNVLKKIKRDAKLTYIYNDSYHFHYINETMPNFQNYTFLCLAESGYSKRFAFEFLHDIYMNFWETIPKQQIENGIAYCLQSSKLHEFIDQKIQQYNQQKDKITELKKNVQDVKELMVENIDHILERGEKIDILVQKTETMYVQSTNLRKQCKQIKREFWWRDKKLTILLIVLILIAVYIISSLFCGFTLENCL